MTNHPQPDLPPFIIKICNAYADKGYECVVVGGFVRDIFMNKESNDIDLATNAPLEVTKSIFNAKPIGEDHGTLLITDFDEPLEITRYRKDILSDGRHSKVIYTDSLLDDLARRDFTFNSIAYNPLTDNFIDPFDGINDAKNNLIRFVGNTADRISEDHLRAIRYYRFIATYDCNHISSDSLTIKNSFNSNILSKERIMSELQKIFQSPVTNELDYSLSELSKLNILSPFGCESSRSLIADVVSSKSFVPIIITNLETGIPISDLPIPSHDKKLAKLFLRTINDDIFTICNYTKDNEKLLFDLANLRAFYEVSDDMSILSKAVDNNLPLSPNDVDLSGSDLHNMGIHPGCFSETFASLLRDIHSNVLTNSRDSLLSSVHLKNNTSLNPTLNNSF